MSEPRKETSGVPPRLLFINVLLSGFISLVVFVVCAYLFVIPRLLDHERRLDANERTITEITQIPEEDDVADEDEEAVDPAAPAVAPAPAAGASP